MVGLVGGVAGQGQEHVVEGGAVDGEVVDRPAGRVDLVEQGPDLGGAAVGGHPDGQAVAVGLDARGRTLQARGWTASGGDLFEVLQRLEAAGCRRFVHTEVARDGMLTGPATDRLGEVLAATSRPVIASGGVARLDDLRALAALEPDGLEGAIVGKALYAGRFTVAEALAVLAESAPATGGRR